MTLRTQLFIVVIILFSLLFLGTFSISVKNTQDYLVEELEIQAQNTASALGVSISQYSEQDTATKAALIDSIFKTGLYQSIHIESLEGKIELERQQPVDTADVPQWFINLFPLHIAPGKALIMSGWKQSGVVFVYTDTGQAYQQLWSSVLETFWWYFGSGIVVLILGLFALRFLLKPLRDIANQANAICNRDFSIQNRVPKTKELSVVVLAMNKLSTRVEAMFENQTKLTEQLREQAYKDSLTGLGNRRYFNMRLEHLISSPEEFFTGALFLLELKNIAEYKKQQGYEACELYINRIANTLREYVTTKNQFLACRLSDINFVLLTPNLDIAATKQLAESLSDKIKDLHANIDDEAINTYLGVAIYHQGQSASKLLSEADMALRAAESKEPHAWHMYNVGELQESLVHGASHWQEYLEQIIATENLVLHYQPIADIKQHSRILHHEVLMRIPDEEGNLLNAGLVIPMAENLNLMQQLDKLVIHKLITQLENSQDATAKFSINLSPSSIRDESFISWLHDELLQHQKVAKHFIFELPEYTAAHEPELLQSIINRMDKLGCEFSLDHFGRGFTSFQYLRNLKIAYLKIDGSYIRHINKETGNQFFIHVVTEIAHNLEIKVIAENVETHDEVDSLQTLNIDGIQGYFIGKPKDTLS